MTDESVSVMLRRLERSNSRKTITSLSNRVRAVIDSDDRYSLVPFTNLLDGLISSFYDVSFLKVLELGFVSQRVAPFTDDEGTTRVSFGLTYIQNHLDHDADLDSRTLKYLSESIEKLHLTQIVSDICVNNLQWSASI